MLSRRVFRFFLTLFLLLGLTACDRIKAKIKGILRDTIPSQPTAEKTAPELTPEEQAMNRILEDPNVFEAAPTAPLPKAEVFELNKSATVSILGYHDFRDRGGTPMIINHTKFREQMLALKEAKIPVVPLSQVMEWKKGRANIPEECVVITMDDGWVGVYTYAFPILKEFGYPFTIYLYKKYVNIGGRSLTWAQIKEMMDYGCEIGSHSVSHAALTSKKGKTDADYQTWLLEEMRESKFFLETNLPGVPITSFAYPFGNHNDDIANLCLQVGYDNGVTVNNAKVAHDTANGKLGRFIIHGESDGNFRLATTFRSRGGALGAGKVIAADAKDESGQALVELYPAPNSTVAERRPTIQANLTRMGAILPESIRLRIPGLGQVPASYDAQTSIITYRPPIKLRREDVSVTLFYKRAVDQPDELINWSFRIDLAAAYLPEEPQPPAASTLGAPAVPSTAAPVPLSPTR